MKEYADRSATQVPFSVEDKVYVYTPRVELHQSRKLAMFWTWPYTRVEKLSEVLFQAGHTVDDKLLSVPLHVNRMKPAYLHEEELPVDLDVATQGEDQFDIDESELALLELNSTDLPAQTNAADLTDNVQTEQVIDSAVEDVSENESNEPVETFYEIEKILKGRYHEGSLQYLIKWKGFSSKFNTWEPEYALNDTAREYLAKHPVKITGRPDL